MAKKKTTKPERSPGEQEICDKYSDHNIKPGSLMWADHPDNPFKGKRCVVIICPLCSAERPVCTSDLFHVHHCRKCADDIKRGRIATKKAKK